MAGGLAPVASKSFNLVHMRMPAPSKQSRHIRKRAKSCSQPLARADRTVVEAQDERPAAAHVLLRVDGIAGVAI